MKLNELLESTPSTVVREQYDNRIDVAFEYEVELILPGNDVDYKQTEITGTVLVTKDAYGTGDSPTDYEFEVEHIIDQDTGKPLTDKELTYISKDTWDHIETTAIEKVQRHM